VVSKVDMDGEPEFWRVTVVQLKGHHSSTKLRLWRPRLLEHGMLNNTWKLNITKIRSKLGFSLTHAVPL
jgi:hypothetical protein